MTRLMLVQKNKKCLKSDMFVLLCRFTWVIKSVESDNNVKGVRQGIKTVAKRRDDISYQRFVYLSTTFVLSHRSYHNLS